MADYLDADLAIAEIDPVTKEIKATPYFEDYLYKVIFTIGGEGSTIINELVNTVIAADKLDYLFALVKSLKNQVSEISNTIDSPILDAKVKTMQTKLSELEGHFDHARLDAVIKQIDIRTANFISKIKTTNYTAENKDWIEARGSITVYLPSTPIRDDEVMVSNGDGTAITVDGNRSNIKYTSTATTFITRNIGSSYHFQYFEDNGLNERYWRVR